MNDIYRNNFILGLAVVTRKTKRKAYHLPDTLFPSHELLYIDEGAIYTSTDGHRELARQGDLLIWQRDTRHGQTLEVGQQASTLGINYDNLDSEMEQLSIGLHHLDDVARDLLSAIVRHAEPNDSGTMVFPNTELRPLLHYLACSPHHNKSTGASTHRDHRQAILHAMNYINKHCDSELNLDVMANECTMSITYFSKVFHKISGQTFKAYLKQCRIERAKALLETKEYNITQVASACGFSTIHYFSLVFKQETGMTPSMYSKKI